MLFELVFASALTALELNMLEMMMKDFLIL